MLAMRPKTQRQREDLHAHPPEDMAVAQAALLGIEKGV